MPAIELGRLQQQVNQLSDLFQDPGSYLQGVDSLLKDHAGPVHRQGRVKGLRPMLHSYEVPPPLLKILTLEMSLQAKAHPQEALAIADGLWEQESMETRQLAVHLLGSIVLPSPEEITKRLESWASENQEQLLTPELAGTGTRSLRSTAADQLLNFAAQLLNKKDYRKQILCLGMLQNLVLNNHFPDLPRLFDLLIPACQKPDRRIRPELASILGELARTSPKETEYFLGKLLSNKPSEDCRWLVRQAMKALPEESRLRLQEGLSG
jgi:hypothetical protein